jgi:hypothetical protein
LVEGISKKTFLAGIVVAILVSTVVSTLLSMQLQAKEVDTTRDVNVLNFPQGWNVTNWQQGWKEVTVVENLNITWNTTQYVVNSYSDVFNLSTVSTEGYNRIRYFMIVKNMTNTNDEYNDAYVYLKVFEVHGWGEIKNIYNLQWSVNPPDSIQLCEPSGDREFFAVNAPNVTFTVQGYSYTGYDPQRPPTISCLVSVYAYMRNE